MPFARLAVALLLALALGPCPSAADEKPAETRDDIFPLSAVRPGMKGHGLTVKQGTKIERFEVEVIDVIRNHLVKQDVILVRCLGEAFADHQIAQGMSGSPIYFEGKVAGALAYTWAQAKHPIGGVTPIETMLAEGKRKLSGRPTGMQPPTRIRRVAGQTGRSTELRPIGTPITVGGFSHASRNALNAAFAPHGFSVCGGGAVAGRPQRGADWVNLDAPVEPGSAVVVDLLRGDYSAAAIGTCTFVDGKQVYGFGHDFNMLGETLLPMSVGYVYSVIASRDLSFKLGSSIREIGALVQDRPSGIVGHLGKPARMVPVQVRFTHAVTKREETFEFEVTPNTVFFTQLLIFALKESFARAEATLGQNTKRYRMTAKLKGLEPWTYEDVIAGFDGGFQRQLIGLVDRPLNHPTQRPEFESFKLDVEIEHRDRRAYVRTVGASREEVRPGEQVTLRVGLETKDGGDPVEQTLDVRIPHDAPEGNYVISVLGGDFVPAAVPTPKDIADYPKLYAAFHKSTELVAVLPTGRVDLDLDGHLLRDLPLSAVARLARSPGGRNTKLQPVTEKVIQKVPFVVAGRQKVTLRVVR
ncbi:MAG: SpoIVB peptidase S55 domain-containing protein [Planctomycetota bacterium]|nr:SpoIVB peptidase S55 domain-containing protein [Planctomycetota bacterium]